MKRFSIYASFFILNFLALGLGGLFTGDGVASDWYENLIKAPWTPPGWVFGAAWSTIMICYTFYMGFAWSRVKKRSLQISYSLQFFLNVIWSPVFFHFHQSVLAFFVITALSAVVIIQLIAFHQKMKWRSILLLPYILWLVIATSLNLYIVFAN